MRINYFLIACFADFGGAPESSIPCSAAAHQRQPVREQLLFIRQLDAVFILWWEPQQFRLPFSSLPSKQEGLHARSKLWRRSIGAQNRITKKNISLRVKLVIPSSAAAWERWIYDLLHFFIGVKNPCGWFWKFQQIPIDGEAPGLELAFRQILTNI